VVLGLAAWWYFRPAPRVTPAMVLIPAGDFLMGDQSLLKSGNSYERPVHTVQVSAFSIGNCEVTKAEWDVVTTWAWQNGFTDLAEGKGKAADHPVHSVSWYDVVKWCNACSRQEGLQPCYTVSGAVYQVGENEEVTCDWSANGYRLPTEAEWEKAARGGKVGKDYPWGDSISHSRANFREDVSPSMLTKLWNDMRDKISPGRSRVVGTGFHPTYETGDKPYTSPVASFAANGYGVHDMAGNVWELCWDLYEDYPASTQTDPRGGTSGSFRVIRGGCWYYFADGSRVAGRYGDDPTYSNYYIGFRIARSSVPPADSRERE
jgi:formylglycine-generating enzyme required for sulfatase activity